MNRNGRGSVGVVVGAAVLVGALGIGALFFVGKATTVTVSTIPVKSTPVKPVASYKDKYAGFELVPGVYKMAWTVKDPPNEPSYYSMNRITADEREALMGKVSMKAYCRDYEGSAVVLEESGGKFTAYVFLDTSLQKGARIPLSKGIRMSLSKKAEFWSSDRVPVSYRFGAGSRSVTKQGDILLRVRTFGKGDYDACLLRRGAWQGMVQTTNGIFAMQLKDNNADGTFGQLSRRKYLCSSCGEYHSYGPDQLIINGVESSSYLNGYFSEGYLAMPGVDMVAGKLYNFTASPTGETVTIEKYTGKTGTLKFVARDGRGKAAGFTMMLSSNDDSFTVSGVGSRTIQLPPGSYEIQATLATPNPPDGSGSSSDHPIIGLDDSNIKVAAGKITNYNLGGPIRFVISPAERPIAARYGSKKIVSVLAKAGNSSVDVSAGPARRKIVVRVYDSGGGVVMKKDIDSWNAGVLTDATKFDVGELGAGDYTLKVSYDSKAYCGKVSASAKIHVEK